MYTLGKKPPLFELHYLELDIFPSEFEPLKTIYALLLTNLVVVDEWCLSFYRSKITDKQTYRQMDRNLSNASFGHPILYITPQ